MTTRFGAAAATTIWTAATATTSWPWTMVLTSLAAEMAPTHFYFYFDFGAVTISDYTAGEKIWICIGSGQGNGNGQVRWTGQANGSDWEITVNRKYSNGVNATDGTITLTGVSADPGSDIAWSDPEAADGTGCDLLP